MRVLHVAASLSYEWGGPVPVIKKLAEGLVRRGTEVDVVTTCAQGEAEGHRAVIDGANVRFHRRSALSALWTGHSRQLARDLEKHIATYDLIHIHEMWHHAHFAAYRAATASDTPYLVTVHGGLEPECLGRKRLRKKLYSTLIQRRILDGAAALHAITPEEGLNIRRSSANTRIVIIPNGIDPMDFDNLPASEALDKQYPDLAGKLVILFLGRIDRKKGLDVLARAFGEVASARSDVRLVIAGPDSDRYQLCIERLLKQMKVRDKVIFTGMVAAEEKRLVLSRAAVVVIPSYSDVRTIVALEAMVCA